MKGELVRAWTEDGLELQGLLCLPEGERKPLAILHIHGSTSNFYRNHFVERLGETLVSRGYPFLTANTRGHDIINRVYARDPKGSLRSGTAYEVFEDCPKDIAAWVDMLVERGSEQLVLSGHSYGALKVAFYQARCQDQRVKGLVFASPGEIRHWTEGAEEDIERALTWARQMVESGRGGALLDVPGLPYPTSARTLLNLIGPQSAANIFHFSTPGEPWEVIGSLRSPMLAIFGTEAEFVSRDVHECLDILKEKAVSSRCDTHVIEGAPHNYRGHEGEAARVISEWVEGL